MEYLIAYVSDNLGDVELHLTSNPQRVAANELYQILGFKKRDTNAYIMRVKKRE